MDTVKSDEYKLATLSLRLLDLSWEIKQGKETQRFNLDLVDYKKKSHLIFLFLYVSTF